MKTINSTWCTICGEELSKHGTSATKCKEAINASGTEKRVYFICNRCNSERGKSYRKTEAGKRVYYLASKRSNEKYPEKLKARQEIAKAIKKGDILKPKKCTSCGEYKELDAHHPDYSKPLYVIFLCRQCHAVEHRKV